MLKMKDIRNNSRLLYIEVLEYSIKTTTSLLTKWALEDELKRLKEKQNGKGKTYLFTSS